MTLAYFDCFAGAGGDMIVGALLDAGADFEALKAALAGLDGVGFELSAQKVQRHGLAATHFVVTPNEHDPPHRHLADILSLVDSACLSAITTERIRRIFTRLAEAEAKAHGIGVEEVHFHEVGAIDSIVDIVAGCVAMELLSIDDIHCSPLPLGSGQIRCDHGILPVPAPATAELVTGFETLPGLADGELTTPTAAAVLTTLAEVAGPMPPMRFSATGYGAGTRNPVEMPNVLRVVLGEAADDGQTDTVVELSANIDDCTGEVLGAVIEMLLSAGCLDAWAAPIVMKKSRPAWMISALCTPADVARAEQILFTETTTFGIRRHQCQRKKLMRRHETVQTPYGPIRVKVGSLGAQDVTACAEFTDCLAAAQSHHVAVKEVISTAQAAFQQSRG